MLSKFIYIPFWGSPDGDGDGKFPRF
uniref:Uncharacterized protein n=1 Tax=Rhizophora mucronata TaxID=61149 RepID=A0A2P2PJJ8_RHIMU